MKVLSLSLLVILSLPLLVMAQSSEFTRFNTMGIDFELLSYGGSLGGFYKFHPSESVSLSVESDWSLVESPDSFAAYDYYNQPFSINNKNLSFVKLLAGISWFPFLESMHSSMQIGGFMAAGPVFSLNTADDGAFTERWQNVDTNLAPMIQAGIHLKATTGQGTYYNFKIGYDYASFDEVIDSRQTYKGIFVQAGVEFLHR